MTNHFIFAALGFGSALSVLAIGFFYLRVAKSYGWQDFPGSRSLHQDPVVTSGGLILVITWLVAGGVAVILGYPPYVLAVWCGMTFIVSVIGFWDDRLSLSVSYRLVTFFLIVSTTLIGIWYNFGVLSLTPTGLIFLAFMVVAGVWWLNVFNFMDGADGLATAQALFMIITFGMVSAVTIITTHSLLDDFVSLVAILVITGSSVAAFLFFVAPTAVCFLGNAGSLVLGQSLLVCGATLVAVGNSAVLLSLVGGLFIWDATITLLLRWIQGKPISQAHTEHVYQIIIQSSQERLRSEGRAAIHARASSHRRALILFMMINVLVILPTVIVGYFTNSDIVGIVGHGVIAMAFVLIRLKLSANN